MEFISIRVPPVLGIVLDPETDEGIYLEEWDSLEKYLDAILDSVYTGEFSNACIHSVIRCILSPDPRERERCFEIALCLMERSLLDRNILLNILVEYLTDEIDHYGIDLILKILNSFGDILPEDLSEIYIPLLTKTLNIKIRREVINAVTRVYTYSTLDTILRSILKYCRQFNSMNTFVSLVIIHECSNSLDEVSKESCRMISQILSILLGTELHQTVKKVSSMLVDYDFMCKLAKNSREVVEGLFDVVYALSKNYWKKTDQFLACKMLESLFYLNNKAFDESLRRYNHTKYTEISAQKEAQEGTVIHTDENHTELGKKRTSYPL